MNLKKQTGTASGVGHYYEYPLPMLRGCGVYSVKVTAFLFIKVCMSRLAAILARIVPESMSSLALSVTLVQP